MSIAGIASAICGLCYTVTIIMVGVAPYMYECILMSIQDHRNNRRLDRALVPGSYDPPYTKDGEGVL